MFFYSVDSFANKIIEGRAKIIDGDTIHIGENKIRLHGIDAPEINQTCSIRDQLWNCGIKSSKVLSSKVTPLFFAKSAANEFLQVHSEIQVCLKIPFILTFV